MVPVAVTEKVVLRPAQTVELAGCEVMAGALFTVSNAPFEVAAGAQVPVTTQR